MTRAQFAARLSANPPTRHLLYARYLAGSSTSYNARATGPRFGAWLRRKHPQEFARLFAKHVDDVDTSAGRVEKCG